MFEADLYDFTCNKLIAWLARTAAESAIKRIERIGMSAKFRLGETSSARRASPARPSFSA